MAETFAAHNSEAVQSRVENWSVEGSQRALCVRLESDSEWRPCAERRPDRCGLSYLLMLFRERAKHFYRSPQSYHSWIGIGKTMRWLLHEELDVPYWLTSYLTSLFSQLYVHWFSKKEHLKKKLIYYNKSFYKILIFEAPWLFPFFFEASDTSDFSKLSDSLAKPSDRVKAFLLSHSETQTRLSRSNVKLT